MIRSTLAAAIVFATLFSAAWAQTVTVRSGEHDDFTRLVFNMPGRLDVALRYQSDGVALTFEREALTFNTDTVFDMVPTTRLSALSTDGGEVQLTLQCLCDIETFWASDRAFVVDISDETEVSAALFPAPPPDQTAPPTELGSRASDAPRPVSDDLPVTEPAPPAPNTTALDLLSGAETPNVGSVAFLIADALDRQPELASPPGSDLTDYANRVRESQAAIVQQIGRAATQGLLSPRDDLVPQSPDPVPDTAPDPAPLLTAPREQPDDTQTTTAQTPDTTPMDASDNVMISAQTSVDQALSNRINLALGGEDSSGCMSKARVDAASWAQEGAFIDQIGPLRSKILGEFDEPSEDAIMALARFYIHFGFGAEARQVMGMLPVGTPPDPVLQAMINILEFGDDGSASMLAGHMDCDPVVAVWSLLSYDEVPGNQPIDPDGIVRGTQKLPLHLRAFLGPLVGDKLRRAGYPRAADHVARALLRNDDTTSTAAGFLNAQNKAIGPDAGNSEAALEEVIADNAAPSAEALLQLIEGRLAQDEPLSEDMALLAGAYAMEYRDVPMGGDLARAYILSLASTGAFGDAFAELDRLTGAAPAPRPGTMTDLMEVLTRASNDPTFLTYTIGADPSLRFELDDEVGNAVATRLISLGFFEAAGSFVAPLAMGGAERARKLLRAEIALQAGRPRQAELELIGEGGEDVTALIARARGMAGEHGAAQDMYSRLDDEEAALRQALLDGDWETLQTHSDPAIAAVAARQATPIGDADPSVAQVLARNTAMIEDSQSMRSEIEALLGGITVPEVDAETDP
ncbi:MAG: hypothetical protein AAF382_01125 [Pseudomonadota bacterium]